MATQSSRDVSWITSLVTAKLNRFIHNLLVTSLLLPLIAVLATTGTCIQTCFRNVPGRLDLGGQSRSTLTSWLNMKVCATVDGFTGMALVTDRAYLSR